MEPERGRRTLKSVVTFWIGALLVGYSHCAIGSIVALWTARHYRRRWLVEGRCPQAAQCATYRSAGLQTTWVSRLPRSLVCYAGVTLSAASTLVWPAMLMSDHAWRWFIGRDHLREEDALFAWVAFAVMLALSVTGVFALRLIARVEDPDDNARLACHVAWATASLFVGVASFTGFWWLLCVSGSLALAAASLGQAMSVAHDVERELTSRTPTR